MYQQNDHRILDAIRQGAMTVREISATTGVSRITLYKYLAVLEARGAVRSRYVGSTKVYAASDGSTEKSGELWHWIRA